MQNVVSWELVHAAKYLSFHLSYFYLYTVTYRFRRRARQLSSKKTSQEIDRYKSCIMCAHNWYMLHTLCLLDNHTAFLWRSVRHMERSPQVHHNMSMRWLMMTRMNLSHSTHKTHIRLLTHTSSYMHSLLRTLKTFSTGVCMATYFLILMALCNI